MKKLLLLSLLWAFTQLQAQTMYFPPLIGNTWDTISPASLGWCTAPLDDLMDYLEANSTKAFILLKDGRIVRERYFGTFTQDSLWYWASAGKTLTAFTVGIAQQENHLSLDDTTAHYIGSGWTNCLPAEEEKITIRHQVTMSSGLDDGVPDHYCTLDTCLNCIATPGTRWAYHNGPYTLLDPVIEAATGTTLNNYINQKIKMPTGMTGQFYQVGYNNIFISKPRSMARFGLLLLNRGVWNGTPVLNDTAYFNQMTNSSQALNPSYGYLTWLNGKSTYMVPGLQLNLPGPLSPNAPPDMYAAMGKNGQTINVWPSENIVWIRMGNAPDAAEVPFMFNDSIWKHLMPVFCTTGTDPAQGNHAISLSPNPTRDVLRISTSPDASAWLRIQDVTGRVLHEGEASGASHEVDVRTWNPGIYLVHAVFADGSRRTMRALVAR